MQKPMLSAICSAFVDNEEPEICTSLGASECDPGAWGTKFCLGSEHRDVHRTTCVETFMSFDCVCGDGFEEMPKADGKGVVCIDVDECQRWAPCDPRVADKATASKRFACHNLEGSYECAANCSPCLCACK